MGRWSTGLAAWVPVRLVAGGLLILAAWAAGEALVTRAGLPLPAPVCGMALLFGAFVLRPGLAVLVQPAAGHLLHRLPLFLYPVTAGFLTLPPVVIGDLLKLLLVLLVSLGLSLALCARIFHWMRHHGR